MICVGLSERDLKNFGGPLGGQAKFGGAVAPWHPPSSAPGHRATIMPARMKANRNLSDASVERFYSE